MHLSFPNAFPVINDRAEKPEVVAIGPYHRHISFTEFEEYKCLFLDRFLSRERTPESSLSERYYLNESLRYYLYNIMEKEGAARRLYAQDMNSISRKEFAEMMLLDGCFVVELLRHLGDNRDSTSGNEDDDPIFTQPWLIRLLSGPPQAGETAPFLCS